MKTVIEMAREAGIEFTHDPTASPPKAFVECWAEELERFVELVRADERNSWPAEMEAMERQVNILTDALAEEREKWMERTAILIRGEREACAKVCDDLHPGLATKRAAEIIRARGNT